MPRPVLEGKYLLIGDEQSRRKGACGPADDLGGAGGSRVRGVGGCTGVYVGVWEDVQVCVCVGVGL